MFPPKGTLITPEWPARDQCALVRAVALPRSAGRRRRAGGRRPHAGRSGDHPLHRLLRQRSRRQAVPVARGARRRLRRALLRRRQRRDPHRAGFAQPAGRIHRDALSVAGGEARRCATDSGGAGQRRGGLGYEKHYRALVDCRTIVTADRVRLGCYGVNGGKAGKPFCVTVDLRRRRARTRRSRRRRAGRWPAQVVQRA